MMYKLLCLVALLVLGIVHTKAEQALGEAGDQEASDLYIDDKGQKYDEFEGSTVSDDEDSSGVQPGRLPGDDEDGEGSGGGMDIHRPASHCEREVSRIKVQGLLGAEPPQCTENGEYKATQCSGSTGQCWCVNFKGEEIPGTISREPWKPKCDTLDRTRSYPSPHPQPEEPEIIRPVDNKNTGAGAPTDTNTDVILDPPSDNEQPPKTDINKGQIDIDTIDDPADDKTDTGSEEHRPNHDGKKEQLREGGLLRQPLMLAGLIAIAVVCLLCAVLLVMFIVYRMRKKDEGSYALDEPKRSPSHPYQRAPTREFFA